MDWALDPILLLKVFQCYGSRLARYWNYCCYECWPIKSQLWPSWGCWLKLSLIAHFIIWYYTVSEFIAHKKKVSHTDSLDHMNKVVMWSVVGVVSKLQWIGGNSKMMNQKFRTHVPRLEQGNFINTRDLENWSSNYDWVVTTKYRSIETKPKLSKSQWSVCTFTFKGKLSKPRNQIRPK